MNWPIKAVTPGATRGPYVLRSRPLLRLFGIQPNVAALIHVHPSKLEGTGTHIAFRVKILAGASTLLILISGLEFDLERRPHAFISPCSQFAGGLMRHCFAASEGGRVGWGFKNKLED